MAKHLELTAADRREIDRYQQLLADIREATGGVALETEDERKGRIQRLRDDYAAFCTYYFPHYCKAPCAPFHVKAAKAVLADPTGKFVFEMFRGAAKSVHFTIFLPLWLKARGECKFMVLIGSSDTTAIRLITDLQVELDGNARYVADYGEQMQPGTWGAGDFQTQDGSYFVALGRGRKPRGFRKGQNRPDYVVADDVDDDEMSRNQTRVEDTLNWVYEAVMPMMIGDRQRFVWSGNRISQNSVLAKLADNKAMTHIRVNALDERGRSTWPEMYTAEYFKKQREVIGSFAFEKEFLNNPIVAGRVFKSEWVQWKPALPLKDYHQIIGYFDPSVSATGDYKAIKVWGKHKPPGGDWEYHLIAAFVRKCEMKLALEWLYDYHEQTRNAASISWFIEASFAQSYGFMGQFAEMDRQRGYTFPIRKDTRAKPAKEDRIIGQLAPLYERRVIWYNEAARHTADMKEAVAQLLGFERGSKLNDDSPDADEGALFLIQRSTQATSFRPKIGSRPTGRTY